MATRELSLNDFGLLIAYVLPGFVALAGTSYVSPEIRTWMGNSPDAGPTIAGFLFMTMASLATGLTVSTIRWLLVDAIHHFTGIRPPSWDFTKLKDRAEAFSYLVEVHYRFYQFYANSLVALVWVFVARRTAAGWMAVPLDHIDAGFLAAMVVFFLGSRDTLGKYYRRAGQLLQQPTRRRVVPSAAVKSRH